MTYGGFNNSGFVTSNAGATGYTFEWHSGTSELPPVNSAFAENHEIALDFEKKASATTRDGYPVKDLVDYANCNGTNPLQRRCWGEEKLEKVKFLKQKWDPQDLATAWDKNWVKTQLDPGP
ncbi:hypothetical protein NHQ30_008064 [Ciborinia camelliae]|nr:hypothetical protein NHQ30_008064 [Ciborinia camelliae]